VRVFQRENRGLVATLNELLQRAQGEFIARMDADDICLPDRFERQLAHLRAHPAVVCVGGDHVLIDERGRRLTTVATLTDDAAIQREALRGHGTICHPSAMLRRAALEQVGGYRAACYPAEDLDLWLRLGEIGELANLRGAVLQYRLHAQSISGHAAEGRQRAAGRRCCEDAWRRRGIANGVYDAAEAWRPTRARQARHDHALRYGWWAWNSGERRTSAVYAAKALRVRPWSGAGWRLLAVALMKPRAKAPLAGPQAT
jgi:glycosyltransferase involved in cell wall biosynthesis